VELVVDSETVAAKDAENVRLQAGPKNLADERIAGASIVVLRTRSEFTRNLRLANIVIAAEQEDDTQVR